MTEIYRIETMLFAAHKMIKEGYKRACGKCGKEHTIPRNARFSIDPDMGGFYWECGKWNAELGEVCKSTMFAPVRVEGFEKAVV